MFVETKNIQAQWTDHFAQYQEQKYTSINEEIIYWINRIQYNGTEKQLHCLNTTIYYISHEEIN